MSSLCRVDVYVWVYMCASWGHRQTHGSLRSNEYYKGVDHRGTRPITHRQAPHISPLYTDTSLSASLFSIFLHSVFCLSPTNSDLCVHPDVFMSALNHTSHICLPIFIKYQVLTYSCIGLIYLKLDLSV